MVTQATLSRDIRELGLAKLADPQGGAYYAHPHRAAVRPDLAQVLPALLVSVDGVGPLLVLKTASGSAGAITEALDQAGWAEIIGTIAGDDTVLVITRSQRTSARRSRPGSRGWSRSSRRGRDRAVAARQPCPSYASYDSRWAAARPESRPSDPSRRSAAAGASKAGFVHPPSERCGDSACAAWR